MFHLFRSPRRPQLPPEQRVYAVGDVHGRLDLLDALIARIEEDDAARPSAAVTLVMLGDLIDRGPESRKVVARVREGVAWAETVALMGNHEAVMIGVLAGDTATLAAWLRFGGLETMASWGVAPRSTDEEDLIETIGALRDAVSLGESDWLHALPRFVQIGDYYFVHAGIRPGRPLNEQTDEDRLWIREPFLKSRRDHGVTVVHGHSIMENVIERPNRIGLDTGAYASGRLTAVGLEGAARWFLATGDD